MNDKFLYKNRPPVRQGFGENLYVRITDEAQRRNRAKRFSGFSLRVGLACLLGLGVLFTFSQPVRAGVLDWIKQVAGFEVQETNTVSSENSITIKPTTSGSMDNMLNDLPFAITMPSYISDGFNFEDKVQVHAESVFMTWRNSIGDQIMMQVDTDHGQRYLTGIDAAQEIKINGQPAMLVQGGYLDDSWDSTLHTLNIIQRKGDLIYWLIYFQKSNGFFDDTVWKNELTRMMSSIE